MGKMLQMQDRYESKMHPMKSLGIYYVAMDVTIIKKEFRLRAAQAVIPVISMSNKRHSQNNFYILMPSLGCICEKFN